jgi:hypothetical protein
VSLREPGSFARSHAVSVATAEEMSSMRALARQGAGMAQNIESRRGRVNGCRNR